jgi:hypothetical membrane protein
MKGTTDRTLLIGLILLPVFYFGMQLLLAPAFPRYSLLRDAASVLGADWSPVARWFNFLAVIGGLLGMMGAWGAYRVFVTAGGGLVQAMLLPAILAIVAAGSVWAGIFPMPHRLHAMNPSTPAMFVMPFAALIYTWWAVPLRTLRTPLLVNLAAFLVIMPFMTGLVPIDRDAFGGLLQRLLALTIFLPIGLVGWQLRQAV